MDVDETDVGVMDFDEMDFDVMDVDEMDIDEMDVDEMDVDELESRAHVSRRFVTDTTAAHYFHSYPATKHGSGSLQEETARKDSPHIMPPPNYFAPEASATAVEKAHSSLRARLRSEDIPAPQGPTNPTIDPQKHIYAKLQAIFSQDSYGQADSNDCPKSSNLADIFALYGQDIYNLSIRAVQAAHENTSAKISAFHAQAANTSAHTTHLYNNISYPLSATLCQSENFPSASLGRHMRTLHKRLSAAETELDRLNEEWKRCVGEEARILSARAGTGSAGGGGGESGGVARKKQGELVARIDDVVRKRGEEIDELDEEYRHLLWTESNRMIQAMMAD
ncbi:hypothetical protein E4U10_005363 [Claviceps purpurea]|nr:hypothetical protein E4U10_005363 [Claviceps purpurea]